MRRRKIEEKEDKEIEKQLQEYKNENQKCDRTETCFAMSLHAPSQVLVLWMPEISMKKGFVCSFEVSFTYSTEDGERFGNGHVLLVEVFPVELKNTSFSLHPLITTLQEFLWPKGKNKFKQAF